VREQVDRAAAMLDQIMDDVERDILVAKTLAEVTGALYAAAWRPHSRPGHTGSGTGSCARRHASAL